MEIKTVQSPEGEITLLTMTNQLGASATVSTLGAGIVAVCVPDRDGKLADVVLGYESAADFMADGPCAGKVPGRYANRIAKGHFTLDGQEYTLAVNNGPNALHGGPTGFQNRIWTVVSHSDNSVCMQYVSADGEEGYPGQLTVRATYTWTDNCTLELTLEAVTDKPTVVNLTNHAYWNLAGHDHGSVLDHVLQLDASHWLPTDDTLIPLPGEPAAVAGTPMDFTEAKVIGRDIKADFAALNYGKGYDNCWVIDGPAGEMRRCAVLADPESGRTLTVSTDQPGVQVYTGNWLEGCPAGKGGAVYHDYAGVAIECQNYPDAPNRADFPSAVLRPGETYRRSIHFAFGNK